MVSGCFVSVRHFTVVLLLQQWPVPTDVVKQCKCRDVCWSRVGNKIEFFATTKDSHTFTHTQTNDVYLLCIFFLYFLTEIHTMNSF